MAMEGTIPKLRLARKGNAAASPRSNLRDLPVFVCNLLKIGSRVTYLPTRKVMMRDQRRIGTRNIMREMKSRVR